MANLLDPDYATQVGDAVRNKLASGEIPPGEDEITDQMRALAQRLTPPAREPYGLARLAHEAPAAIAGTMTGLANLIDYAHGRGWQPGQNIPPEDLASLVGVAGATNPLMVGSTGTLGIFAGRNALTANKAALALAEDMAKHGRTAEEIWNRTGWFQGADKAWRFEIPDPSAEKAYHPGRTAAEESEYIVARRAGRPEPEEQWTPEQARTYIREHGFTVPTERVLEHPELYKAYPQLASLPVTLGEPQLAGTSTRGQYSTGSAKGGGGGIALSPEVAYSLERGHSTLLHELQHGTQDIENFAYGTSPDWLADPMMQAQLEKMFPEIKEYEQKFVLPAWMERRKAVVVQKNRYMEQGHTEEEALDLAHQDVEDLPVNKDYETKIQHLRDLVQHRAELGYYRAAGEVEARNVQTRVIGREAFPRATLPPPWETQSVPTEKQFILDTKGNVRTLEPVEEDPFAGKGQGSPAAAGPSAEYPYKKAPESLLGFKRTGPQTPFEEGNYKHVQWVKVTFPDGSTHVDAIKGLNRPHAIARAYINWNADKIEPLTQTEAAALGSPEAQALEKKP